MTSRSIGTANLKCCAALPPPPAGVTYVPQPDPNYRAEGFAVGPQFHGRLTANGEVCDMESLSAAHPTLPIPSYVRVTSLANHKSVISARDDRGPYAPGRIIDVSINTAQILGFGQNGIARVRVEYAGEASLNGSSRMVRLTCTTDSPLASPRSES